MTKQVRGYELIKKEYLADLKADGYLFRHEKTKARICIISNDDDNKVFTIGFRTPPTDETGVPHIMEHSVLCGSKKYPLKDPFIELVKGSLNTFLNAMTYSDKTIYPIASYNDQDFQNLMDVYLNAVFYPNVLQDKRLFQQEGWHYELDEKKNLFVNGVVYNEMKGAYSSPDEILNKQIYASLFPDTTYSKDSGGDPEHIPELTYEDYLSFYHRYYHPSNSYIYLYGDMDIEEKLTWLDQEYLSKFDYLKVDSEIETQKPFDEVVTAEVSFGISDEEEEEEKNYLSFNAVVGDSLDPNLYIAFNILRYVLVSAPGAPLKKALLEAGIGKSILGSYDSGIKQPVFSIVASNAKLSNRDEFLRILHDVLTQQVKEGINKKALRAAIDADEFRYREADYFTYPKGLIWGIETFDSWLYDDDAPFVHFHATEVYEYLRNQIEEGYFENLIQTYLLDNKHACIVTGKAQKKYDEKREQKQAQKMKKLQESLSEEQLKAIEKETEQLKKFQETPDDPRLQEKIPLLRREDLKREVEPYKNEIQKLKNTTLLYHDYETRGITYFKYVFDVSDVSEETMSYLALLESIIGMVDTEHYTYDDLANEMNLRMGGSSAVLQVYSQFDEDDKYHVKFEVGMKCLSEKFAVANELLEEMLLTSHLEDEKRLRQIIMNKRTSMQGSIGRAGNSAASIRIGSYVSEEGALREHVTGISFYHFVEDIEMHFEEKVEEVKAGLRHALNQILLADAIVSVTCDKSFVPELSEAAEDFLARKADGITEQKEQVSRHLLKNVKSEGFKMASQIQFVGQGGNFKEAGFEQNGYLDILKNILNYDYLWNEVRVLGGAYGCSCNFMRNGKTVFTSYRDPKLNETLKVYQKAADFVRNFDASERDMTKYIIGAVGEKDTPLTPMMKGERSLSSYLTHLTTEQLQKERDELLSAQPEDIRRQAPLVEAVMKQGYICAIGNEQKISQEQGLFEKSEHLFH
ncbi:MAG: insulinase family protein [Eubacterium sp.]|nr:insulinase family protein [Eubacterium sp.]